MNSGAGGEPREGAEERPAQRLYPLLQTLALLALLLDLPIFFLVSIAPTLLCHYPGLGPALVALFVSLASPLDPGIQPRGLDSNPEMVWKPAPIDPAEPIIHPHPPPVSHENNAKPLEYNQVGKWELLPRWIKLQNTRRNHASHNIYNQQPVPLDFLSHKEINHHCSYLNEIPSPLRLFAKSHNNILSLSPSNSGLIENVGWASESCILESTQSMRTVNVNGFLLENLILSPLDEVSECLDLEDLTTVKVLLLASQLQPITWSGELTNVMQGKKIRVFNHKTRFHWVAFLRK
ncbi:hypothetical protein PtB15_6B615 [Puccinia triticina]|nr:hypothetical protein PtB15_6B615 [Puccinia triticina]